MGPHDFRHTAVRNMERARVSRPVAINITEHKRNQSTAAIRSSASPTAGSHAKTRAQFRASSLHFSRIPHAELDFCKERLQQAELYIVQSQHVSNFNLSGKHKLAREVVVVCVQNSFKKEY